MKKTKIYQTKIYTALTAPENHFKMIQIIHKTNHHIIQVIEVDLQNKKNHEVSHQIDIVDQIVEIINIEITIHDRIQTEQFLIPVPNHILGIDNIPTIDQEIHHTIEIETILTKEIEVIQIIEINIIQTTDQEITHIIDQIIKDPIIIIKTDRKTTHKIEIQAIILGKEIIPNLDIGIITVIPILNTDIEATHQSIKDNLTKYKRLKKQLQTTRYR